MTIRRKVLLAILVGVFVIKAGMYWRIKHVKNQVSSTSIAIKDMEEEIASLSRELGKMMAEANAIIANSQHLPPPTNGVSKSYHEKNGKKNYENSWIQDIDQKNGIILVTTMDSKMSIVFKPSPENLAKFNIGWLAPVTFQCTKRKKGKCDFKYPYKLFVLNGLVEVKELILPKK